MNDWILEIILLLILLVANGLFAMAEIAVVSARKSRLRSLAQNGNAQARLALELAESPNRFLSTVQVGITLVGILAGAYGGATLSEDLAAVLARVPLLDRYAEPVAFALVVAVITYLSLIIGELVPKRLGLSHPEAIAMAAARPMNALSRLASPLIRLLGGSTDGLLRLFGFRGKDQTGVSADEVRGLMQEGVRAGSFNRVESEIVHSALELDQLSVHAIMTPRPKIIWLNQDDPHELTWHKIVVSRHSDFPVYRGSRDNVVGVVAVKALYANLAAGAGVQFKDLMTPPLLVPETQSVLQLVETFKQSGKHVALVSDEFGAIVGLVTLNDVMEAVIGEFPAPGDRAKPAAQPRVDGTWLIDAMLDIDSLARALPGFTPADPDHSDYQTLAGYVIKRLGHIPREGETFVDQGYLFEVLDMDQHRVDKDPGRSGPPPGPPQRTETAPPGQPATR
jgi:putative hemolysin